MAIRPRKLLRTSANTTPSTAKPRIINPMRPPGFLAQADIRSAPIKALKTTSTSANAARPISPARAVMGMGGRFDHRASRRVTEEAFMPVGIGKGKTVRNQASGRAGEPPWRCIASVVREPHV
jgi:hypothetical protein